MTENGVDTTFTYNDWGRTVSKQKTAGQTTYAAVYTYFAGDKLKRVVSDFPGEAGEVAFNYDGLGKRRKKLVDGTETTWWRWDAGWGMIAEYGGDGSWTVGTREMSYTLLGMSALADVAGTNPSTGSYRYYAQDHLGSLRALYDGNKALTGLAEYGPYGTICTATGPAAIPGQLFTGKPLDIETGLYYFPYRYYSPTASRWLTRDPLGMVDGPNVYGYLNGSVISATDLYGLSQVCVDCAPDGGGTGSGDIQKCLKKCKSDRERRDDANECLRDACYKACGMWSWTFGNVWIYHLCLEECNLAYSQTRLAITFLYAKCRKACFGKNYK